MSMFDYSDFWHETLRQLHEEFIANSNEDAFNLWFNIEYVSSVQGAIMLAVPSKFFCERLKAMGYIKMIEDKLFELLGQPIQAEFVVQPKTQALIASDNTAVYNAKIHEPLADFAQDNQQVFNKPGEKLAVQLATEIKKHENLNPSYTFSSFVQGDNNSFAYNAAIAIAKNPGNAYNPILIYGSVGLGKTHLMQAIGNEIYSTKGGKVLYVPAADFTNEFTQSIKENTTAKFKSKYRSADVLLIDDIHFLQKRIETQEELFHIFNTLYESKRQLVFTCDRPLSEIKNISDRLKSRFERGLNVDLNPPDYETRRAILEKKLENKDVEIPPEVLDLIAKNVVTNVRDLESSLTKVIAYTELTGQKATVESANKLLRDTFGAANQGNVTIETIQKIVAEAFNISFVDIKSRKQTKNIVFPRQVAMYITKKLTEYSTTEIGTEFNGKDHTTVMHAIQKIENAVYSDSSLATRIEGIERKIKECQS